MKQVAIGAGVVGVALLMWQSWTLSRFHDRLVALEQAVQQDPAGRAAPARLEADQDVVGKTLRAVREARVQARDRGLSAEETEVFIEEALEGVLERREQEKKEEGTAKWIAMATENMEIELEDMAREFQLDEVTRARAVDLLVGSIYEGIQLKEDLADGRISLREAKADGEALREETAAALMELIGEEAADELGARLGWK